MKSEIQGELKAVGFQIPIIHIAQMKAKAKAIREKDGIAITWADVARRLIADACAAEPAIDAANLNSPRLDHASQAPRFDETPAGEIAEKLYRAGGQFVC